VIHALSAYTVFALASDTISLEWVAGIVVVIVLGLIGLVYRNLDGSVNEIWVEINKLKEEDKLQGQIQAKLMAKMDSIEKQLDKIPDQSMLTAILTQTLTSTLTTTLKESEARLERYVDKAVGHINRDNNKP